MEIVLVEAGLVGAEEKTPSVAPQLLLVGADGVKQQLVFDREAVLKQEIMTMKRSGV